MRTAIVMGKKLFLSEENYAILLKRFDPEVITKIGKTHYLPCICSKYNACQRCPFGKYTTRMYSCYTLLEHLGISRDKEGLTLGYAYITVDSTEGLEAINKIHKLLLSMKKEIRHAKSIS